MTTGLILAAGGATRFGRPKLREPLRGKAVIHWAIEAAADAVEHVIVVSGADDISDLVDDDITLVHNPNWAAGIATSLTVGIQTAKSLGYDAVVVGLGDQPFIPTAAWKAVANATSPIAIAEFDGYRGPPVRLHSSVWHLLPTEGDEGARKLMASRPDLVVAIPCSGEPADIDTQEDLARWS